MKTAFPLTPSVPLVSEPTLNETQRQLRGILEYWGPNGEKHVSNGSLHQDGGRCAVNALAVVVGKKSVFDLQYNEAWRMMDTAADEMGFSCSAMCSDSGFDNARKMVRRAIELAQ